MTFHSYSKWTLDDPVEDAPINDIALAVEHHGYAPPGVFGIWTVGDSFIFNVGTILSKCRGEILNQELIEGIIEEGTPSREKVIQVIIEVLKKLELYEKTLPVPKPRPSNGFKNISLPLVNKSYPPLSDLL